MSTDLEARIADLEARQAVTELFYRYAQAVRRESYDDILELFVSDGTFEVRSGYPDRSEFTVRQTHGTPQALVAFLSESKGKAHPIPLIHNPIVDVIGDTATANAMMVATITGTAKVITGEYHDSFVRQDGRWLFSERIYTVFG